MAAASSEARRAYVGKLTNNSTVVTIESINEPSYRERLPSCYEHVHHSPDGFAWGYHGSGPAQLAFAMLYHATDDLQSTHRYYQDFKREVIAELDVDKDFIIPVPLVRGWMMGRKSRT